MIVLDVPVEAQQSGETRAHLRACGVPIRRTADSDISTSCTWAHPSSVDMISRAGNLIWPAIEHGEPELVGPQLELTEGS